MANSVYTYCILNHHPPKKTKQIKTTKKSGSAKTWLISAMLVRNRIPTGTVVQPVNGLILCGDVECMFFLYFLKHFLNLIM